MNLLTNFRFKRRVNGLLKQGADRASLKQCLLDIETHALRVPAGQAAPLYAYAARLQEALDQPHKAIQSISKAMALRYTKSKVKLLAYLLGVKHTDAFGTMEKEVPFLESLLQEASHVFQKRIYYRLQLIHEYGQASSLDKEIYPNFKKAFFYKDKVGPLKKTKTKKTVDIVTVFDAPYAPHAGVMMTSALYHQGADSHYVFHILSTKSKMDAKTQKQLRTLKAHGDCTIKFHFFDESSIPEAVRKTVDATPYPMFVVYRLFFSRIFKTLDRIISLDGDMIVQHDLTPLATMPLQDKAFWGASDPIPHLRKPALGLRKSQPYVNGGMIVANLKKMRVMGFEDRAVKPFEDMPEILVLLEQDVINMCFQKEMGVLSCAWNVPIRALVHKKYLGQPVHRFWPKIFHFILYAKKSKEKRVKPWIYPEGAAQLWQQAPHKIPFYMRAYWAYRDVGPFKI